MDVTLHILPWDLFNLLTYSKTAVAFLPVSIDNLALHYGTKYDLVRPLLQYRLIMS